MAYFSRVASSDDFAINSCSFANPSTERIRHGQTGAHFRLRGRFNGSGLWHFASGFFQWFDQRAFRESRAERRRVRRGVSQQFEFSPLQHGNGPVATINWGTNAGAPGSSTLNFFPNQSVAVSDNVEFEFGTVTFYNGTSTLESLIFGVDLVLDFVPNGGGPSVDTLTIHVGIGTTFNGGDASANADFISIPGISYGFFAFEDLGATAIVRGTIVGDPQFSPDSFTVLDKFTIYTGPSTPRPYDPADYTTYDSPGFSGGFLGPTPTPEPSSLVLLVTGVFSFIGLRSVRRFKKCLVTRIRG
ncbi:MAG: PEP-CTERM sorting domain-containing protein [Planctomycetaceae bacterium]|nr:PEP-CTERM sorting domain-containing protein [Planctomycetaceae bacterium]